MLAISGKSLKVTMAAFVVTLAGAAQAAPITGEERSDSFDAKSTNAANYASTTKPYVLFESNAAGKVTLHLHNPTNFSAWFEYRSDGETRTSGTAHYFIPGEYVYDFLSVAKLSDLVRTFDAAQVVELRSAFGPENDWYFDWTAFDAGAAVVPSPAVPALLVAGIAAIGLAKRRRSAD